jgi:hypothetical protein
MMASWEGTLREGGDHGRTEGEGRESWRRGAEGSVGIMGKRRT